MHGFKLSHLTPITYTHIYGLKSAFPKGLEERVEELEIREELRPSCSIVEISQNAQKSPEDMRNLVTQTPVKDHQLMLV